MSGNDPFSGHSRTLVGALAVRSALAVRWCA
jgi:hypothetical protein